MGSRNVLIAYATGEGQTGRVSSRIADIIREAGYEVDLVDLANADPGMDLGRFRLVVLAGSIHMGRFQDELLRFAKNRRSDLERCRSAFFFLCLTAADRTEEAKKEIDSMLSSFEESTGLRPDRTAVFAGSLAYTKYGFVKKWIMKSIAGKHDGATDTSRDYEYTDWDEVARFAEELVRLAAAADTAPAER
jgi:menaquinone-dependent protoporphyrinogen oxidase